MHDLRTGKALTPNQLPLPLGSIIGSMSGRKEDKEMFYSFSSFTTPGMIYRFDFTTMTHSVFRETKVNGYNDHATFSSIGKCTDCLGQVES